MLHVYAPQMALPAKNQGDVGQPFPSLPQCWPKEPKHGNWLSLQYLSEFSYHASRDTTSILQGFTRMPYHGISGNINSKQRTPLRQKEVWPWGHIPYYPAVGTTDCKTVVCLLET